ncbi:MULTISPECIES: ABC transporter permease [unclassified Iodidimonas]|uniref:ABC transporter permease n=1 Tax=unclassified Iodidimonas TaxID=2626145 RepID=UPI0024828796|nr:MULTISPECIES: ABC transporter permease [unclassified Iodidimonas]
MSSQSKPAAIEMGSRKIGRINGLGLWTLYEKEVRRFLKVWMQTIGAPAVQAILFFVIFAVVLGGSDRVTTSVAYTQFLAPGLIIMALLQNSFANTSSSLIIAKVQGTIVDVLMPPLSPGELSLGFVAGGVTRGLVIGLVLIACFALLPIKAIMFSHPWAILYFGVMASIMLSLMGILTGIWAEKFDHVATITNFIVGPLTLLSGTFYSIDRLRDKMGDGAQWLEPFLAVNPFFYIIDGFRYGFIGEADGSVLTGAVVVGVINLFLWLIVWRVLQTGWRLKS